MEKKEEHLCKLEDRLENSSVVRSELFQNNDGFTSIPDDDDFHKKESESIGDQIDNLIEKTKFFSLEREENREEMYKAMNDKNKEERRNNNYFRKRFSINEKKSTYFNPKPKPVKKEEVRPTPSSELKSRLDFRTRIPTIVDDVYLDRGNTHQRHKGNYKSNNQNMDKKFDKPFEKKEKMDILVTKDFKTSSRQVVLNGDKKSKENRPHFGPKEIVDRFKDDKKLNKNFPQILTPPLTPSSSKFDPPPGLPMPTNVNQNYADKEYAAAIAAFLLSNPIFNSNGAELANLSNSSSPMSDTRKN